MTAAHPWADMEIAERREYRRLITHPDELCCPNCGADSNSSRLCDYRGDWGEGDEVVTCNECEHTYGHAVPVRYIVEQWKVGTS